MHHTETALASAFKQAGFVTSSERLRNIAVEAWTRWSKPLESSDRLAFVREKLQGEITWHMMEQFAPMALRDAVNALMRDTAELIAAEREKNRGGIRAVPGSGGQCAKETQSWPAPAAKFIPPAQAGGRSGSTKDVANPITAPSAAPNLLDRGVADIVRVTHHLRHKPGYGLTLTEMADKQAAAGAARLAAHVRLSKLDTFLINGQKIGDVTASEAVAWAGSRDRDVRFVRLLTANLPPDRPIREFVSAEDADTLYASAEQVET
jgi:hypothetical protein